MDDIHSAVSQLPCILCGGDPAIGGALTPKGDLARALKVPPGKTRVLFYTLCGQCFERPGVQAEVEKKFSESPAAMIKRLGF